MRDFFLESEQIGQHKEMTLNILWIWHADDIRMHDMKHSYAKTAAFWLTHN